MVRGGGEAGSKANELAQAVNIRTEVPVRLGEASRAAPGSTKTTAPVNAGGSGWQQAMLQSIPAFLP